jgi:hypothetical protein
MNDFELESTLESAFDKWYAIYPKKQARATAEKAWQKLKLDRLSTTIILRTQAFIEAYTAQGKLDYLPMPATFLNQRRWEDELAKPKPVYNSAPVEQQRNPRIRLYNGQESARSSDRESVEDNCKAFNKLMEQYGFPHRDYNY